MIGADVGVIACLIIAAAARLKIFSDLNTALFRPLRSSAITSVHAKAITLETNCKYDRPTDRPNE